MKRWALTWIVAAVTAWAVVALAVVGFLKLAGC